MALQVTAIRLGVSDLARSKKFHGEGPARETVDEVIANAVAAGGAVVKEAAGAQRGGYSGYFSDPDGYLWKVATPA